MSGLSAVEVEAVEAAMLCPMLLRAWRTCGTSWHIPLQRLLRSGQSNLQIIKNYLAGMGYAVKVEKLRSDHYGLPQRRARLLFFGLRDCKDLAEPKELTLQRISARLAAFQRPVAPVEPRKLLVMSGISWFRA